MIRFENVSKRYPSGQEALSDINFCLEDGEMAFLTGHSGAGKSTMLKLIMMLERATTGTIWIDQQDLANISNRQIPFLRRKMGVVHQNHQLLFDRSVFDNVALPLIVAGFSHRDVGRRVRAALDKVGLLHKEGQNPLTLSGGEQQRVGIARAVVNKPPFLLADEPTGNLDPALSKEILLLFKEFNNVGVTVLIATHDLALIARLPHRSLILREARLLGNGNQTPFSSAFDDETEQNQHMKPRNDGNNTDARLIQPGRSEFIEPDIKPISHV